LTTDPQSVSLPLINHILKGTSLRYKCLKYEIFISYIDQQVMHKKLKDAKIAKKFTFNKYHMLVISTQFHQKALQCLPIFGKFSQLE
jgi:hypothetical protein